MGYYLPWGIFSGILLSVGCGLISLYSPTTSMSQWIGYQTILGAGRGTGMQIVCVFQLQFFCLFFYSPPLPPNIYLLSSNSTQLSAYNSHSKHP